MTRISLMVLGKYAIVLPTLENKQVAKVAKAKVQLGCLVKELPAKDQTKAADMAIDLNPFNRPEIEMISKDVADQVDPVQFLAVLTTKYWGTQGVNLGVSFMETTVAELRDKIISHMNAWSEFCNVHFAYSQSQGEVRISRGQGGYYSYLGTDILHIAKGQQTMNLEAFTLKTPDSEYKRVVRHETGHTLGFPHEHMRKQIVARLDPAKTIAYFQKYQGWDANTTQQQVLTPVDEASIMGTPNADEDSIMCYQLPAAITKDGKPIAGGDDINDNDKAFAAKLYPLTVTPKPPANRSQLIISYDGTMTNPKIES